MDKKKRYTGTQKAEILRDVLEKGKAVSAIAEEQGINPNLVFKWRKQLLEGASVVFDVKRPDITAKAEACRIAELESALSHKDEVIAELASELLALKKKSSGAKSGGGR